MKKLIFSKWHMNPTLLGKKKMTIRQFRPEAHNFIKGEIIKGVFEGGLTILLTITLDTEIKSLSELTDSEAKEAGHFNAFEAAEWLKENHYPDLDMNSVIAIIRYEVLNIEDTPVVCFS